jgi:hypothetical protein
MGNNFKSNQVNNIYHNIKEFYENNPQDTLDEFDIIVLNNVGIFVNYKLTCEEAKLIKNKNGDKAKVVYWDFKQDTLVFMLNFISVQCIPAEPVMTSNSRVLHIYLNLILNEMKNNGKILEFWK